MFCCTSTPPVAVALTVNAILPATVFNIDTAKLLSIFIAAVPPILISIGNCTPAPRTELTNLTEVASTCNDPKAEFVGSLALATTI